MAEGLFEAGTVPEKYERYLVKPIFEPWARRLVDFAGVRPGDAVVDVASGTGTVARTALQRVGAEGRVVAADISPAMLAVAAAKSEDLETVVCPATALKLPDDTFDVALCQQGFQFFADRAAAAAAMRRVLRPGGTAAIAVWLCGPVLEPFDIYGEVLEAEGIAEPFPGAYAANFCMSAEDVGGALETAGLASVEVVTEVLEVTWPSEEEVVAAITGTVYGPAVAALDAPRQHQVFERLASRLNVRHQMTAVLGRAGKN